MPSSEVEKWMRRFYRPEDHPYRLYEKAVRRHLEPSGTVVLDAGCGRSAEVSALIAARTHCTIGMDMEAVEARSCNFFALRGDLSSIPLRSCTVDLVISRSVMEHVADPANAYREVFRVLKPGGSFIFLTPNFWDYASLLSKLIPNRYHPWIVNRTEGRAMADTFPVYYRANTLYTIEKLAGATGFTIDSQACLGQYPCYAMFSSIVFLIATAYEKLVSRFNFLRQLRGWLLVELNKPYAA